MATETILSPGVLLQEVDKSFVSPGTDPSGMAINGPTARGPIEIPTQIKNYNEFKCEFRRSGWLLDNPARLDPMLLEVWRRYQHFAKNVCSSQKRRRAM